MTEPVEGQSPTSATSNGAGSQQLEDLQQLAYRMWRGLPTKERLVHLQTFKYTFAGRHAVAWLLDNQEARSTQEAVDLCSRLLATGFIKSCLKQETFTGDGELFRFVSAMAFTTDYLGFADPNYKSRSLSNKLQATQLYKEIAKIGKAAAQPFKTMALDQLAHQLTAGRGSGRAFDAPGDHPAAAAAAAAKLAAGSRSPPPLGELAVAVGGPHERRGSGDPEVLLQLVAGVDTLQSGVKEQLGLVRLDLQQHTALQEHLVGLLSAIQQQQRQAQALMLAVAGAGLMLLLVAVLALAGAPAALAAALAAAAGGAAGCWGGRLWARGGGGGPATALALALKRTASKGMAGGDRARPDLLLGSGDGALRAMSASVIGVGAAAEGAIGVGAAACPGGRRRGGGAGGESGGVGGVGAALGVGGEEEEEEEERGVMSDGDFEDGSDEDEDALGALPCLADFEGHPDSPLLLRVNRAAPGQVFPGLGHPHGALRLNSTPHPFESELFKGVVAVYVRHLGTTPGHLFRGKKRLSWVVLQGQFKRPVSMDALVFGQEFQRAFRNLPAPWFIENMLLPLARKIAPSLRVGSLDEPFLGAPLITASQIVNVARPGCEPGIMDAKEDMTAFDPSLSRAGQPLPVAARRKHFQSPKARQCAYAPGLVWTFHLWQEYLDYASYVLALPYSTYDLTQHLDGQPLQVMVRDGGGPYMLSLLAWHASMVRSMSSSRAAHLLATASQRAAPLRPPQQQQQPQQPQQQQQQPSSPGGLSPPRSPRLPYTPSHLNPGQPPQQQQQQQQQGLAPAASDPSPQPLLRSYSSRASGATSGEGGTPSASSARPLRASYHGGGGATSSTSSSAAAPPGASGLQPAQSTPLPERSDGSASGSSPRASLGAPPWRQHPPLAPAPLHAPQQQQHQQQQQQQQLAAGTPPSPAGAATLGHLGSFGSQQHPLATVYSGEVPAPRAQSDSTLHATTPAARAAKASGGGSGANEATSASGGPAHQQQQQQQQQRASHPGGAWDRPGTREPLQSADGNGRGAGATPANGAAAAAAAAPARSPRQSCLSDPGGWDVD